MWLMDPSHVGHSRTCPTITAPLHVASSPVSPPRWKASVGLHTAIPMERWRLLNGHTCQHVFPWRRGLFTRPCSLCHWLQLVQKAILPKHILTQRASLKGLEKIGRGDLRVRDASEKAAEKALRCNGIHLNTGRLSNKVCDIFNPWLTVKC